jgi:tetratricopeptide (TPR) repeat protein
MSALAHTAMADPAPLRRWQGFYPLILVAMCVAAYGNSFDGVFVFDDGAQIVANPRVHEPTWLSLLGRTRPLTYSSLAANYYLGGLDVRGFHAFNLSVHILAALALYGLVRRTLMLRVFGTRFTANAAGLALAIALLWAVHPLQTESVMYIVQRAQALSGLFYFLTLFCLLRGATGVQGSLRWYVTGILACALGMASKEEMLTAPVVALLYDRVFLASSWGEVFRRRWGFYVGLAATWAILAGSVFVALGVNQPQGKETSAGFAIKGLTPLEYARSQPGVILHYLGLALWPRGLCLDYDWPVAQSLADILPAALVLLILLFWAAWALWRRPALGFVLSWFFLTLALTSSVVPIADLAAERRMYLPLASIAVLAVVGVRALLQSLEAHGRISTAAGASVGLALLVAAGVALAWTTARRNRDYADEAGMWKDVLAKRPSNLRARNNLGAILIKEQKYGEAIENLKKNVNEKPDWQAVLNLATAFEKIGQNKQAATYYREAIRLLPDNSEAILPGLHFNLANTLDEPHQWDEAITQYREAIRLKPDYAMAYNNLARILANRGELDEAIACYQQAIDRDPNLALSHNNLALTLVRRGRLDEALSHYRRAVQIDPSYVNAYGNWGTCLLKRGKLPEAVKLYRRALEVSPGNPRGLFNLAHVLWLQGSAQESTTLIREGLRADPAWPRTAASAAWRLATHADSGVRDPAEAVRLAEQAVLATGNHEPVCLDVLAAAYASAGRFEDAARRARDALALAQTASRTVMADKIQQRLHCYENRTPYRESKDNQSP